MSIIVVIGFIILQVLAYGVGIYVIFDKKISNVKLGSALLIISIGLYYLLHLTRNNDMLYIRMCVILWVLLEGTLRKNFIIIIKGVFILACSEEVIESLINIFLMHSGHMKLTEDKEYILANSILLIIGLVLNMIKRSKFKVNSRYINAIIMVFIVIMAGSLALVIACVQYAEPYVNSTKFSFLSDILITISYLSIVVLGIFIIYIKNANKKINSLLEIESLLRFLQKNNYEVMLAKEEETKEFRHDLNNHIICLKEMIKNGDISKAYNYINQMQTALSQIKNKSYHTGNEIIDSILNYHIQQLVNDVDIKVNGLCDSILDLKSIDLCSIIANPLQNAVEALNDQKQGKKYLKFQLKTTQNYLLIEICNSFDENNIEIMNGMLLTNKPDKDNHGIGLKNVKKLIERNNGLFNINIKQNEFRVMIKLPFKE